MEPLEQALALKNDLDSLRPIGREQELKIFQKFRLDWNYHSNSLEGNSLTYGETKALLFFGLTAQGKPLKDHLEIEGHNEAIEWIIDIVRGEYPLTESFIREIHILLLKQSYSVDAITPDGFPTTKKVEIGKYKTQPNHVITKTGEIFRFASPEETPALMGELIKWYHEKIALSEVNPILLAAEFHYRFIRIHPFDDGNGRTARILMNFILMRHNFPPVIIKTEEKNQYFSALQLADSGIIQAFIDYIATSLVHSLDIMIRGAKGESIEEPDDIDKELALLERRLTRGNSEIERTNELVWKLFALSIVPLFDKYVNASAKFDKFYTETHHFLSSNNYTGVANATTISSIKKELTKNSTTFEAQSSYKSFIHSEQGNFEFHSGLEIILGNNSYILRNKNKKISLEKKYDEQLTPEEIDRFVNFEQKRHIDFIETEIKENGPFTP